MTHYIDKDTLVAEIEKRYEYWKEKESNSHSIESEIRMSECQHLLLMLDSLQEEPVSEDLEKAAIEAFKQIVDTDKNNFLEIFKAGAEWQKEQEIKYKHRTFLQGEKSVANYILKMIDNGWHINAIYTVCKDKLKED